MKISDKGLTLIKSQEAGLYASPPLAAANAVYKRRINVTQNGNFVGGQSFGHGFANNSNFAAGQLPRRGGDETISPLLLGVDGQRDPLKIACPVVGFGTVNVVYRQPLSVSRHKRSTNKAVDQKFLSAAINLDCNNIVSMRLCASRKKLGRFACRMLRAPSPCRRIAVCKTSNAPEVGYLQSPFIAGNPVNLFPRLHSPLARHESLGQ